MPYYFIIIKSHKGFFRKESIYSTIKISSNRSLRMICGISSRNDRIVIRGKGDKIRTIYLLQKAVDHLRNYLKIFHGDTPSYDSFVFYSRNKGPNGKLSQSAIRKMLRKYALPAHEENNEVPINLHAHQFRHARASHWLEEGMNIVQISLLLGHEHLETTMVYLDITIGQEAEALTTLEDELDKNTVPKWNPDKDSLASLCGLRKLRK